MPNLLVFFILVFTVIGISIFSEYDFYQTKTRVLNSDPKQLSRLGKHFIVGYKDFNEVKHLLSKEAIGVIFITRHNVARKSYFQIKKEIETLQTIQRRNNRPQLFVATDQEDRMISRISPPLSDFPSLPEILDTCYKQHGS